MTDDFEFSSDDEEEDELNPGSEPSNNSNVANSTRGLDRNQTLPNNLDCSGKNGSESKYYNILAYNIPLRWPEVTILH